MKGYQDKSSSLKKFLYKLMPFLSTIIMLLTITSLIYIFGGLDFKNDFNHSILSSLRSTIFSIYYKLSDKQIDHLKLHISPMYMEKLKAKREEAIKKGGILIKEEDDEVTAYLTVNNSEPVKVNVRLKGDWTDHLETNKWSFRVEVKKGLAVFGMREFSLQRNETRGGHGEALLMENMREEGILAPRYFYVALEVNGKHRGIYALEEHFSKELLESQGRRESVILALNENPLWRQRQLIRTSGIVPVKKPGWELSSHLSGINSAYFKVFQEKKVWRSDTLQNYYKEALGLIRGYKEGFIPMKDVFDIELLAKYIAVINFWDAGHGMYWHNLRFYYNPITRLFEPIAFDNEVSNIANPEKPEFHFINFYQPFADTEFLKIYNQTLSRLEKKLQNREFTKKISSLEKQVLGFLKFENRDYKSFPEEKLKKRLIYLKNNPIKPAKNVHLKLDKNARELVDKPVLAEFLNVFCVKDGDKVYLEFQNITDRPVKINEISFVSGRDKVNLKVSPKYSRIPPNLGYDQRYRLPVEKFPEKETEFYRVTATFDENNARKNIRAVKYYPAFKQAKYRPDKPDEFAKKFPFMDINEQAKNITLKKGTYNIKQNILVPEGFSLIIEKGAVLNFAPNIRFVVRAPLKVKGEKTEPVIFKGENWKGVIVIGAKEESLLENAFIQGINLLLQNEWYLTGGVSFYESDVRIKSCIFDGNTVEDALNIIRSSFNIEETVFKNTQSDAFDSDFSHGSIKNSIFKNIDIENINGGDAIDFSGSKIKVSGLKIINVSDKAISVGEKSDFAGDNITITNANIAIASKDSSKAVLKNSRIRGIADTAYMAYIKKNEYGKSQLKIVNTEITDYKKLTGAVYPCTIEIDGEMQGYQIINVKRSLEKDLLGR